MIAPHIADDWNSAFLRAQKNNIQPSGLEQGLQTTVEKPPLHDIFVRLCKEKAPASLVCKFDFTRIQNAEELVERLIEGEQYLVVGLTQTEEEGSRKPVDNRVLRGLTPIDDEEFEVRDSRSALASPFVL
eukprot:GEMP01074464.1.p1 GENE.GEMP01074464.1~~GEMP01074464.1.p1  ORF type:complete len:130 (+),score=34.27 GEMP01074464.1:151-540(+)